MKIPIELQEKIESIRQKKDIKPLDKPVVPHLNNKFPIRTKLLLIQQFMNALEYNYTGTNYFDLNKNRSFKGLVSTAKSIIEESLPIQCLEAVFLSAFLTSDIQELDRFPLSFKSKMISTNTIHRHIVLAVRHQNIWGALGLSRSDHLMFKDLKYKKFSDLIEDYIKAYSLVNHQIKKIYIGLPFSHNIHSTEKINWRVFNIRLEEHPWNQVANQVNIFSKEINDITSHYIRMGDLPSIFYEKLNFHVPPKRKNGLENATVKQKFSPEKQTISSKISDKNEIQENFNEKINNIIQEIDCLVIKPENIVFRVNKNEQMYQGSPINFFIQNSTNSYLHLIISPGITDAFQLISNCNIKNENNQVKITIKPKGMHSMAIQLVSMEKWNKNENIKLMKSIIDHFKILLDEENIENEYDLFIKEYQIKTEIIFY